MDTTSPAVELEELTFTYALGRPPVVRAASLSIPRGARCVLVGANGAGKSTLMGLVAGKRKPTGGHARALGEEAFETTTLTNQITFVTNEWSLPVNLPVAELLASAAVGIEPSRVRELVEALDARALLSSDVNSLSDGQRRRVQLLCTLLPPRELVLLDEVTNSLDVLARARLLRWLRESESERRGATVVFCSHIFDGLDGWATHVAHVDAGAIAHAFGPDAIPRDRPLHETVARWLADDATRAQATSEYQTTHLAGARKLDAILADAAARGEARRAAFAPRTPLAALDNAAAAGGVASTGRACGGAADGCAHGGDDGEGSGGAGGADGASAFKKARAEAPDGSSAAVLRPPPPSLAALAPGDGRNHAAPAAAAAAAAVSKGTVKGRKRSGGSRLAVAAGSGALGAAKTSGLAQWLLEQSARTRAAARSVTSDG